MTTSQLRIAIAQINLKVGDIAANTEKVIEMANAAKIELRADLVVFPELTITGYPPEDLLHRRDFMHDVVVALECIQNQVKDIDYVIGHPHQAEDGLYNAASVYQSGERTLLYYKQHRPNYSVFDEKRYFKAGNSAGNFTKNGFQVGVVICEDLWRENPINKAKESGSEFLLSLNASPFNMNKPKQRETLMQERAKSHHLPLIYVHSVGGQDTLVFDGGSMVINAEGETCQRLSYYEERLALVECEKKSEGIYFPRSSLTERPSEAARIYSALRLGVRDYIKKNNFEGVIIGVSGGIDSALTLAIAVDALGSENVTAVMLPSRYTSEISLSDAKALAENLGVRYREISIEPMFENFIQAYAQEITPDQSTESTMFENVQARFRAILLMALANETNRIVLTTGNKSEYAMGYATLYGDMAGGFSVLGDVYKTWVYRLANYRNTITPVIPTRIITRPPSAELRENQIDEDHLPAYDILDEILCLYVEEDATVEEIIEAGFHEALVREVLERVNKYEFKRRQSPPCVRVSKRAFGRDRRYPITSGYFPDGAKVLQEG